MKKLLSIICLLLMAALITNAQQDNFQKLTSPYLGQKPPEMTPEIFAQGIISTEGNNEFCASFSPDGREFYFNRGMTIMVCRFQKDGWTNPEPALFNEKYQGHEAHVTFDNKRIFFGCSRPPQPYGIWLTEKTSTYWSAPQRMWEGMYVTSVKNGNIYFGVEFPLPAHIVMTRLTDTGYVSPVKQEIKLANSQKDNISIFHPTIAPDESYIIFDDNKKLYVSFRETNGLWGDAISLSEILNEQPAVIPAISYDGKYLFYASKGDLYWVSTSILDKLKQKSSDSLISIYDNSKHKIEYNDDAVLTILYNNESCDDSIVADHGFSCLVESKGQSLLFDAGRISEKFLANVRAMDVKLSDIKHVFVSHIHDDHLGGLYDVLKSCNQPKLFMPYSYPKLINEPAGERADSDWQSLLEKYKPFVSEIVRERKSYPIADLYFSTGVIEELFYEQALIIPTSKGLIIITGCAHPGILQIVKYAKELMKQEVYFVLGGFHLVSTNPDQVKIIAGELRKITKYIGPCHCTGENAQMILKEIFFEDYIDIKAGMRYKVSVDKLK